MFSGYGGKASSRVTPALLAASQGNGSANGAPPRAAAGSADGEITAADVSLVEPFAEPGGGGGLDPLRSSGNSFGGPERLSRIESMAQSVGSDHWDFDIEDPEYSVQYVAPSVEQAKERAASMRMRGLGIFGSSALDFRDLGVGIVVYFRDMGSLAMVYLVICVLSLPEVYWSLDASLDDDVCGLGLLAKLSVAGLMCHVDSRNRRDPTQAINWMRDMDKRDITLGIAALNLCKAGLLIGVAAYMHRSRAKIERELDVEQITLGDYSVKVAGLPSNTNTPGEVRGYFSNFGPVNDVVMVRDLRDMLQAYSGLHKLREELEAATVLAVRSMLSGDVVARDVLRGQLRDQEQVLADIIRKGFKVVSAVVTFEEEAGYLKCLEEHGTKGGGVMGIIHKLGPKQVYSPTGMASLPLGVGQAPEASDIIWENQAYGRRTRWAQRGLAYGIIAGALLWGLGLAGLLRNSSTYSNLSCKAVAEGGNLDCTAVWPVDDAVQATKAFARSDILWYLAASDPHECRRFENGRGEYVFNVRPYAPYQCPAPPPPPAAPPPPPARGFTPQADVFLPFCGFIPKNHTSWGADTCAARTCYACYCAERGWAAYSADVDGLFAFCGEYWQSYYLTELFGGVWLAVIAVTNLGLSQVIRPISHIEHHRLKSHLQASTATKLFASLLCSSALVPCAMFVAVEGGEPGSTFFHGAGGFGDFTAGWYEVVGSAITAAFIINALMPTTRAVLEYAAKAAWCRYMGPKLSTQRELDHLYEGAHFMLAERYGSILNMIFVSSIFGAGLPILFPVMLLFIALQYWVDKAILIYHAQRPEFLNVAVATRMQLLLPIAGALHLAVGGWMLSASALPSWDTRSRLGFGATQAAGGGDQVSGDRGGSVNALLMWMGLPSAAAVLAGMLFGGWIRGSLLSPCLGPVPLAEGNPPLTDARRGGRLKGLRSYDIKDNPEYSELVSIGPFKSEGTTFEEDVVRIGRNVAFADAAMAVGRPPENPAEEGNNRRGSGAGSLSASVHLAGSSSPYNSAAAARPPSPGRLVGYSFGDQAGLDRAAQSWEGVERGARPPSIDQESRHVAFATLPNRQSHSVPGTRKHAWGVGDGFTESPDHRHGGGSLPDSPAHAYGGARGPGGAPVGGDAPDLRYRSFDVGIMREMGSRRRSGAGYGSGSDATPSRSNPSSRKSMLGPSGGADGGGGGDLEGSTPSRSKLKKEGGSRKSSKDKKGSSKDYKEKKGSSKDPKDKRGSSKGSKKDKNRDKG